MSNSNYTNLDDFFQLACSLLENQRISKSMEVFEKLLLADYNPSLILPYMIKVSMMKNDLNAALNYIDLSLDENPEDIELLSLKASILLQKNHFEDVLEVSNQILIIDGKNDAAFEMKLSALKMLQRFDEIEELINNSNLTKDYILDETIYGEDNHDAEADLLDEEFNKFKKLDITQLKQLNNNSNINTNLNNEDLTTGKTKILTENNVFIQQSSNEYSKNSPDSQSQEKFNNIIESKENFNPTDMDFVSGYDILTKEGPKNNNQMDNTKNDMYKGSDINIQLNNFRSDSQSNIDLNNENNLNDGYYDDSLKYDKGILKDNTYKDEIDESIPIEDLSFKTALELKSDIKDLSDNVSSQNIYDDSNSTNLKNDENYLYQSDEGTNENHLNSHKQSSKSNKDDDLLNDFLSEMDKQIYDNYNPEENEFNLNDLDEDYDNNLNEVDLSSIDGNSEKYNIVNEGLSSIEDMYTHRIENFNSTSNNDGNYINNPDNIYDDEDNTTMDDFIQDSDDNNNYELDNKLFEGFDMDIDDLSSVPILVDDYNIPEDNYLVEQKDNIIEDVDLDELFHFDSNGNLIEEDIDKILKHSYKNKYYNDDD